MKKVFLLFLNLFIFFTSYAQTKVFNGYIIKSNGKKVEGVIQVSGANSPWAWQDKIFFHKGITTDKEKIKKKNGDKLSPKDIDGYGLVDGPEYRSIKYTNVSGANQGTDLNTINNASNAISNLKSSRYFAEVVAFGGKINVFKFYSRPPSVTISSGEETEELKEINQNARIFYDVLVWKEDEKKAKSFDDINIKKYFDDCSFVVDKFKNKEYSKKPLRGIKSAINNALIEGKKKEEACIEMVSDYEAQCAK